MMNDKKSAKMNEHGEIDAQQEDEHQEMEEDLEAEQSEQNSFEDENEEEISIQSLQLEIVRLSKALAAASDKFVRAQAEVENIRRRTAKEATNARKFANEEFARELLTVKDSLDLAQQFDLSAQNNTAVEKMREGLELTLRQFEAVFEKFSVETIIPVKGDKLDPQLHQAMTVQDSNEVDNNCVLNLIQAGYQLNGRLLRPAMVVIARKLPEKNTDSDQLEA